MKPLIVDLFAGGGGASTGILQALGRSPDVAVNHSPDAIRMHTANHPETLHLCASVWEVEPRYVVGKRKVDLLWASPDCTHFSRAKGSAPRSPRVRSLAHVVVEWARAVRPRVICLENVEEFQGWGPLLDDGTPCPARKGETFAAWVAQLEWLGYRVEWRSLVAADYGAPTTRRRLFLVARCDGKPIVWPEPTHGVGRPQPWRTAAEVIDWSIPCPSIFSRSKPLADATLRRIAKGLRQYVMTSEPWLAPGGDDVAAWLTKHYTGVTGQPMTRPIGTITTIDHHSLTTAALAPESANVRPELGSFFVKYYGCSNAASMAEPLDTVTTKDRFGLVTVAGRSMQVADIGMRMLTARELFAAQGFPADYRLLDGTLTTTAQKKLVGNSVCPDVARAVVAANV